MANNILLSSSKTNICDSSLTHSLPPPLLAAGYATWKEYHTKAIDNIEVLIREFAL